MKYLTFAILFVLTAPCAIMAGSISGTVKGADGSVVNPGVVVAAYIPETGSNQRFGATPVSALIAPDGTFHLSPPGLGQYEVCVQVPFSTWLGSCEWGNSGTTVSLTQDQPAATVSIVLKKGAAINVQVSDPTGLLSANERTIAGAHLLVGVGMPNMVFRLAAVVSQNASGRTYQVAVPFDQPVGISVASAFFLLSDATGKAIPKFGNLFPVLVPSGQQPPTLMFNLTGTAHP